MIANFDYFNNFELPVLTLCNPNNTQLSVLDNIKNLNIKPNFNAVSEMSFDVYEKDGNVTLDCYSKIQHKRQILVEGLGYFIIQTVSEDDDGSVKYKSVNAVSCEIELNNKKLNYFNGTYEFYNEANQDESLIHIIFNSIPRWTINYIDDDLKERFRTFDNPDQTVYNFLMTDVESTYNCIFEFDIINRTVSAYDKDNYNVSTSVFLSKNDVIENIKINENSDNICTALNIYGSNDLNIRSTNPLGTNILYNFGYYTNTDWMSDDLVDTVTAWQDLIDEQEVEYQILFNSVSTKNAELDTLTQELAALQSLFDGYNIQKSVLVSNNQDLTSINESIYITQTSYDSKQAEIDSKELEITSVLSEMSDITELVSFESNFTSDQLSELSSFIYESTYQDENITTTDIMTNEQIQNQSIELYNRGKTILDKLAYPVYETTIETNGFIFNKAFQAFTTQLQTGCYIDVEDIGQLILLNMDINYEDKTFGMTFGNRYRVNSFSELFNSLYSEATKSANTVNFQKDIWGKPVKSGKLDEMNEFINSAINLTTNAIRSSTSQSINIDDRGLISKKTGSDEQLWLTNNAIAFSENNFLTSKTAIGKILLPDGVTSKYGIAGEAVIGEMIAGGNLKISDENGSFSIDENGLVLRDYPTKFMFTTLGNSNLVKNSSGVYGIKQWTISATPSHVSATPISSSVSGYALDATYVDSTIKMLQTIEMRNGVEYSISFRYRLHSSSFEAYIGATKLLLSNTYENINFDNDDWETYSNTFTVSQIRAPLYFQIGNGRLQISDLIINEGNFPKSWQPYSGEVKTKTIELDDFGITISDTTSEFVGIYDNSKMQYRNENKDETIIEVSVDGTIMNRTTINKELIIQQQGSTSNEFRIIPVEDGVFFVVND